MDAPPQIPFAARDCLAGNIAKYIPDSEIGLETQYLKRTA
jgi:hypothetical protein